MKKIKNDKSSQQKLSKVDLALMIVGVVSLVGGLVSLALKTFAAEYIDAQGILHENFFLIPLGFALLLLSLILFVVIAIRNK